MRSAPILVTGSTGYVGGRLVPQLLSAGYAVRVMGRSMAKLMSRPWAGDPRVEVVEADVMDRGSLRRALEGCRAAYYLVHSMNPQQKDFAQADRRAAQNMVSAAASSGLPRLIYLGGLGTNDPSLSEHLRSRAEVARILQGGPVPTTFLRAAIILGSGSASFEILRYLVERLPVMITPRWVRTPCQPIAIRNVLGYLQGCLEGEETAGKTFDIGGPDVLTYQRIMEIYAEEAGLKRRRIIPVPLLTPRLSSYWIHLVTPVPSTLAGPLVEGLRNPVVCLEDRIRSLIPQELIGTREAIRLAIERTRRRCVETCWFDAGVLHKPEWLQCDDAPYAGGTVLQSGYHAVVEGTPEEVWKGVQGIGGDRGWYAAQVLWRLRGMVDRLAGGIGLRRGRRHPVDLYAGDAVDFWRVVDIQSPRHLLLVAEMKLPGEATLEFRLEPRGKGRTAIRQLSQFLPKGLLGIVYWYVTYPFHQWIFKNMLRGMAQSVGKRILSGPRKWLPRGSG